MSEDLGISGIGAVMVTVSDQDGAIDFFVGKLGFEKRVDVAFGNGERWVEIAAPGSATAIALVPPRGEEQPGGWTHVAFASDDVAAGHAALSELGVDVDENMIGGDGTVPPMFWFRDGDDNSYLLVQRS